MPRKPKHSRWFHRYNPWLKRWMESKGLVPGFNGWISKKKARERINKAVLKSEMYKAIAHQQAEDFVKGLK